MSFSGENGRSFLEFLSFSNIFEVQELLGKTKMCYLALMFFPSTKVVRIYQNVIIILSQAWFDKIPSVSCAGNHMYYLRQLDPFFTVGFVQRLVRKWPTKELTLYMRSMK